jgi:avidin family protein
MPATGMWYNELGSTMTLYVEGPSITGTYQTGVGDASGLYQLVGSIDVAGDPEGNGQAIAWVVVWNNTLKGSTHSITAWSGQYQLINGVEEIVTLWLLTTETPANSDWASTQVNQDIFTRNPPTPQQIMAAQKRGRISHPVAIMAGS